MKKILLAVLFLLFTVNIVYSEETAVQITLTTSSSAVYYDEGFTAMIRVRNRGETYLKFPMADYSNFKEQWVSDNPLVNYSGGVSIVSMNGEIPEIHLKPSAEHTDKISLYILRKEDSPKSVTFRMGFKSAPGASPIWSNPVSVQVKDDEIFPIKIDVSTPGTKVKSWEPMEVAVRITNTSNVSQHVGTEICGVHGVIWWITNDKLVYVQGGSGGCLSNISPPKEIILKPGEMYEQECAVSFDKEKVISGPLTFRIGLKNIGRLPAWSNDITINVEGGTGEQKAQWQKSSAYQEKFRKEQDVSSSPDGIVKRYYETGELYDERTVKDGKLDGLAKYYYKSGKLQKEVIFVKGEYTHWVDYNENGSVQFDSTPIDRIMKTAH